jgi:hypothetical protein
VSATETLPADDNACDARLDDVSSGWDMGEESGGIGEFMFITGNLCSRKLTVSQQSIILLALVGTFG